MGALKPWHIAVVVVVLIVLFGAKKMPDMARSLGKSLRIMKAETKNLREGDVDEKAPAQHSHDTTHTHPVIDDKPAEPTESAEPLRPRDDTTEAPHRTADGVRDQNR